MSEAVKQVAADPALGNGFTIYLADCENVLLREIGMKECKRRDIAQTYRLAMMAERDNGEAIDWRKVNAAIITRWSISGLTWIKEQAWSGKCFAPKGGSR
jgi:hypothetical protein